MALEGRCGYCGNFGHDDEDCPFPTAREVDGAEERARIRRELLAALEPAIRAHRVAGCGVEVDALLFSDFLAALDRIAPAREGKEG